MNVKNFKLGFKLGFFSLVVIGILMLSESVQGYDVNGNTCTCDSCKDCENALNDDSCTIVKLNDSIINYSGTCINNPQNFNNKIFDCQGHKITGSGQDAGIFLFNKTNDTIENCIITNFESGIDLWYSSNITSINNTVSSNTQFGIFLGEGSNNNSLILNYICNNSRSDIYSDQSNAATGDNNTCISSHNYHDEANVSGCKYICQIDNCNCSSCGECNYKLSSPSCSQVNLTKDITNDWGSCIDNPQNFNNKVFNCQGHTITGFGYGNGIYLFNKTNNTIKNCVITGFETGIYLDLSPNNSLINDTVNNNKNYGIFLSYSSNTTMRNNIMENNANNFGINGWEIFYFYQDIDKSNLINGKPIYYWTNKNAPNGCKNAVIDESTNASFVALISCDNITVKNLNLSKNSYGILLVNTTNSKISNNTANNNDYDGINLISSSHNTLINNTANDNKYGIFLDFSSNNIINANRLCANREYDIYTMDNYGNNTGYNNTGDTYYHWNDKGVTGFTYSCPKCYVNDAGTCTIKTGEGCNCINQALNDANCTFVKLNSSVINWAGTCIDEPKNFNNKTLDCQGYTISGDGGGTGILLKGKSNNTIKNCVITNFEYGIHLDSSFGNTLTNNTVNNNSFGIELESSPNNSLTYNTANYNEGLGILLYSSSNNTLTNNKANNNNGGIFLVSSSYNTLTNNTAKNSSIGIILDSSSNNTLTHNTANNNWDGILLRYSSHNTLTHNTANSNNHTGIYIFGNSNFNKILGNKISDNNETGITISNCDPLGSCDKGNLNNTIEGNEILNNTIGVFSNASNSTISDNFVCRNTQWDLYSPANWLSSSGDNNTCDNANGWKDTYTQNGCKYECPKCKIPKDIFDAVEMLEYLSGQGSTTYCDLNNDNKIDLNDVFALIDKIVQN